MPDQVKIAITGAPGRMGQMLVRAVEESDKAILSGVTAISGHDWIGQKLETCIPGIKSPLVVTDDPLKIFAQSEAVIDFTAPDATVTHAELAAQARSVHVIGTTGMNKDHLSRLSAAARHCAIVRAGNMSLGVNLLVQLTRRIAQTLDTEFDIEITEAHHRHKVDAPSGTALMLGEAAAEGRGIDLKSAADRGRDGITGAREQGCIGFHAIRGGDIVGEHDVLFAAPGERIVLRHVATDRRIFARGALKAALWGQGKPPGEYDMMDVLDL